MQPIPNNYLLSARLQLDGDGYSSCSLNSMSYSQVINLLNQHGYLYRWFKTDVLSINRYLYVKARPIKLVDPFGYDTDSYSTFQWDECCLNGTSFERFACGCEGAGGTYGGVGGSSGGDIIWYWRCDCEPSITRYHYTCPLWDIADNYCPYHPHECYCKYKCTEVYYPNVYKDCTLTSRGPYDPW
jgi:hypothetical protein